MTRQSVAPPAVAVAEAPAPIASDVAPAAADADAAPTDPAPPVAVAAPAVAPTGTFTLERGVCFGPCPIYRATVTGDDRLSFEGRKFTARAGKAQKALAAGSFARLIDVAAQYDFASIDSKWPDEKGVNCPEPPTDMPTVSVAIDSERMKHAVKFYEGCAGYPGADRLVGMIAEVDKVLALDDWIGPRDVWYGKRQQP
jgi:hypothetical protein